MTTLTKVELREQALGVLAILDECRSESIRIEIIEELLVQSEKGSAVNLPKSELIYNKIMRKHHA